MSRINCLLLSCLISLCLPVSAQTPAKHSELDKSARESLDLTVYNNGLAVVRDRRLVVMPTGDVDLEFAEVALSIVPQTVSLTSDRKDGYQPHRQTYRYDLLNRQSLLERFVGRKVKYSRSILEDGNFEKFLREGILLSLNPEIVKFGDIIEIEPVGTISLPYIPDDLKTTPTLVFNGSNEREGEQLIDVRYHARQISWEADYAMLLAKKASLKAQVTVRNHSGTAMAIDHLSLVAGDLNQQHTPQPMPRAEATAMRLSADAGMSPPQAVGDYHIYDFKGGVDLLKNDMTQLHLMSADDVKFTREYRVSGSVQRYANAGLQTINPEVWVSFDNTKRNNLGQPLPAGNARFYETHNGSQVFIGEARINHTPKGEEVAMRIGNAFDLIAERTQTEYRRLGERSSEASYLIEIRNGGDERKQVNIEEHIGGEWEVVKQSKKGKKIDATTYRFQVDVPASGATKIEYQVRMSW